MARVTDWERGYQNVTPHRTEVTCFVQRITDSDGQLLVHLSTFGSVSRQSAPKSSQSLQFDEHSARRLVRELIDAFGDQITH